MTIKSMGIIIPVNPSWWSSELPGSIPQVLRWQHMESKSIGIIMPANPSWWPSWNCLVNPADPEAPTHASWSCFLQWASPLRRLPWINTLFTELCTGKAFPSERALTLDLLCVQDARKQERENTKGEFADPPAQNRTWRSATILCPRMWHASSWLPTPPCWRFASFRDRNKNMPFMFGQHEAVTVVGASSKNILWDLLWIYSSWCALIVGWSWGFHVLVWDWQTPRHFLHSLRARENRQTRRVDFTYWEKEGERTLPVHQQVPRWEWRRCRQSFCASAAEQWCPRTRRVDADPFCLQTTISLSHKHTHTAADDNSNYSGFAALTGRERRREPTTERARISRQRDEHSRGHRKKTTGCESVHLTLKRRTGRGVAGRGPLACLPSCMMLPAFIDRRRATDVDRASSTRTLHIRLWTDLGAICCRNGKRKHLLTNERRESTTAPASFPHPPQPHRQQVVRPRRYPRPRPKPCFVSFLCP